MKKVPLSTRLKESLAKSLVDPLNLSDRISKGSKTFLESYAAEHGLQVGDLAVVINCKGGLTKACMYHQGQPYQYLEIERLVTFFMP